MRSDIIEYIQTVQKDSFPLKVPGDGFDLIRFPNYWYHSCQQRNRGELLNVGLILSFFKAVPYTEDSLRNIVLALDRSERMLFRGMVGK